MSRNISVAEWTEIAADINARLRARWPWLHDGDLRVTTPTITASATLRWTLESADVRVGVDRSACVMGGVADIAEVVRQYAEVRDVMLFVHGETSGLIVWEVGKCPCGFCSGRGTSQGSACKRCEGKGKY